MNEQADSAQRAEGSSVGMRWPEVGVAAFLLALAVLVVVDSLRVGIGWADDGPRSGYFPFYIGCALGISSLWIIVRQLLAWRRPDEVFAERDQLRSVAAIAVPIAVYLVLIALLGIYIASFILIAYFMRRHGKHALWLTAAVALGVPALCFAVFERWFLVPLPKGPVEALFGL